MAEHLNRKRPIQCTDCKRVMARDEPCEEIELFRYSRHGVGVAHVGIVCGMCQGNNAAGIAAKA